MSHQCRSTFPSKCWCHNYYQRKVVVRHQDCRLTISSGESNVKTKSPSSYISSVLWWIPLSSQVKAKRGLRTRAEDVDVRIHHPWNKTGRGTLSEDHTLSAEHRWLCFFYSSTQMVEEGLKKHIKYMNMKAEKESLRTLNLSKEWTLVFFKTDLSKLYAHIYWK